MTKKNIRPQQAAPVQREINTTSSESGKGLTPQIGSCKILFFDPFVGDDAE